MQDKDKKLEAIRKLFNQASIDIADLGYILTREERILDSQVSEGIMKKALAGMAEFVTGGTCDFKANKRLADAAAAVAAAKREAFYLVHRPEGRSLRLEDLQAAKREAEETQTRTRKQALRILDEGDWGYINGKQVARRRSLKNAKQTVE